MRIAIDAEAILYTFSGNNPDFEDVVRPSIIGINGSIMDDYDQKVTQDGSGLGKEWLTRIYSSPERVCVINDDDLARYGLQSSDLCESYVGAAYFNGQNLVTSGVPPQRLTKAKGFGVRVFDPSANFDITLMEGHSIVYSVQLNSRTTFRHSIIRRFFEKELDIVIYDKYLKDSSMCLFENVLRQCNANARITLISNFDSAGGGLISKQNAERRIRAVRPHAEIRCYYPAARGNADDHDRHIHLGERLQISFSRGTDCFGLDPGWVNSECEISVHYLCASSASRSYYVTETPQGQSREIRVKSKV